LNGTIFFNWKYPRLKKTKIGSKILNVEESFSRKKTLMGTHLISVFLMVNSCHLATKRNRDVKRLKDFLGKLCSNSADMEAKTCEVILKDKSLFVATT
jgi:hypothetical protein